jgi:hypothetical protein
MEITDCIISDCEYAFGGVDVPEIRAVSCLFEDCASITQTGTNEDGMSYTLTGCEWRGAASGGTYGYGIFQVNNITMSVTATDCVFVPRNTWYASMRFAYGVALTITRCIFAPSPQSGNALQSNTVAGGDKSVIAIISSIFDGYGNTDAWVLDTQNSGAEFSGGGNVYDAGTANRIKWRNAATALSTWIPASESTSINADPSFAGNILAREYDLDPEGAAAQIGAGPGPAFVKKDYDLAAIIAEIEAA